ncbi:acyltransferase [Kitasatospora atroaurantiaca]|uniref:Peptidoglycan/LPS O-acetylase OafA/YrhL n=1 Tax=Kitasatospora atroaurantiaca TaxID=285545 RepID=A0A561ES37_9ACTN|nr:acyltransferase [Kitasatospora atroaurantiaca]TWE18430.1 peptidoglycan/LPS O-acetylase OafA/YrhL [Kitasatospora atroaurantiaca]
MTIRTSQHAIATARARLPSLTGLRFIAAMMVFLFHMTLTRLELNPYSGGTAHALEAVFTKAGWVGVSFFFILSGFVLTWSTRPDRTPRQFWWQRLVKLYPNHLATFALAMVLYASATATWKEWLPNLLLLQAWVPRFDTFFSVNIPSWSLSCELFFYLCFPLLNRWIGRIDAARLWAWAGGVAGVVVCLPAVALALLPDTPVMPNGFPVSVGQYWFVYLFPPVRMLEFVLGILMARILMSGRWINLRLLPAAALAGAGYLAALAVPWLYGLSAAAVVPLALLIPAAASADVRAQASPLRGRVMRWLGEVSFAFYLVHVPVLLYMRQLMDHGYYSAPVATGVVLLITAVSLLLAWLLHIGVERPLMRRWGTLPQAPAEAAARPAQAAEPAYSLASSAASASSASR